MPLGNWLCRVRLPLVRPAQYSSCRSTVVPPCRSAQAAQTAPTTSAAAKAPEAPTVSSIPQSRQRVFTMYVSSFTAGRGHVWVDTPGRSPRPADSDDTTALDHTLQRG